MRIYRPTYRDAAGRTREAASWAIEFRHADRTRRLTLFPDRDASETAGRTILRLVALRAAREVPGADMAAAVEAFPKRIRDNLVAWGILTASRAAAGKALADHLTDWKASLDADETTAKQVALVTGRASRLFALCGFKDLSDLQSSRVKTALSMLRKSAGTKPSGEPKPGISRQTSNFYIGAGKQFTRWLKTERRLVDDPFADLTMLNVETDLRHERRALTPEEFSRLIAATRTGPTWRSMTGEERALLYLLTYRTGLRWSECRSLTRRSFNLAAATVTVAARDSKHRREDVLPLRADLVDALRTHFGARLALPGADDPAFPTMPQDRGADMIAADLDRAGIAYQTADGYADFHSLRHAFITSVAQSGVSVAVAMQLARHSDPKLTMKRYTHVSIETGAEAIAALPDLPAIREASAAMRTGTDDAPVSGVETPSTAPSGTAAEAQGVMLQGVIGETQRLTKPLRYHCAKAANGAGNIAETSEKSSSNARGVDDAHRAIECHPDPDSATRNAKYNAKRNDPTLEALIEAWPDLPDEARERVRAIVAHYEARGATRTAGDE